MGLFEEVLTEIRERNKSESTTLIARILSDHWLEICEEIIEPMMIKMNDMVQEWLHQEPFRVQIETSGSKRN